MQISNYKYVNIFIQRSSLHFTEKTLKHFYISVQFSLKCKYFRKNSFALMVMGMN